MTKRELRKTIRWMLDNCCKQDVKHITDTIETDIPYEIVWSVVTKELEAYRIKHA
jgi:hypothetical protein